MNKTMKPTLEQQFLPAVLEIQETPPSPLGRIIVWVIIGFFITALSWSYWGRIDIIAVAQGKIIPNGHVKVIQPLEIGTISEIYVNEGQHVKAGERLIDLDLKAVDAEINQLTAEYSVTQQQIKRIQALLQQQKTGKEQWRDRQDSLLNSQWQEYQGRLAMLESEKNKRLAEYAASRQQAEKLAAILPIIQQRSHNELTLVNKDLYPKQQYLQTEQQRLNTYYDLKSQRSKVQELTQTVLAIEAQMAHTRSEFTKSKLENLEQAQQKQHQLAQQIIRAKTRRQAKQLTAPIAGSVQQLTTHTIGGIVTPAQTLMIIVPDSQQLEIEAKVENKDIGFVKPGQTVAIKLDAFPFTRYGTLPGKLIGLSSDAIADNDKGLIYKARVSLKQTQIKVDDKQIGLGPGMAARVEIKTGQRRLIEFFMAPLLRYRDESIRER